VCLPHFSLRSVGVCYARSIALAKKLADLYADEVADHREARGDNGQLFGMKIWTHGWFRYVGALRRRP
jgi:hypothetical protein